MNISYPPHITEESRFNVAGVLILHEFKKLFKSLPETDFDIIAKDIRGWWTDPNKYNLAAVRDFWNGADAIMNGFKLKNIVPLITAQNVTWSAPETIEIKELRFTTNLGDLEINTKTAEEVSALLMQEPLKSANCKRESDKSFHSGITREADSVIVVKEPSGYFVHDGNGRLLRAILYGRSSLLAYIGIRDEARPENPWIPTEYLIQLVKKWQMAHEESIKDPRKEPKEKFLFGELVNVLRGSGSARVEFLNRVTDKEKDKMLKEQIDSKLS